jgi:hypothetical protein
MAMSITAMAPATANVLYLCDPGPGIACLEHCQCQLSDWLALHSQGTALSRHCTASITESRWQDQPSVLDQLTISTSANGGDQ